ncbi:uncharacterized protein LOC129770550 isoform X2 [Toxorhynchites rutilus septentrionalis]|uniref:uncharacterized protein LOC129770550 isoform X2 n=1 Tax=Toxorhynchites rutilus septentrionalis TaxID=329112 RepID=UPI00247AC1E7|nr:uncharacterized protein LOC129770550 isoform X2 [Toxorhynchites rutilus septentrionalis]
MTHETMEITPSDSDKTPIVPSSEAKATPNSLSRRSSSASYTSNKKVTFAEAKVQSRAAGITRPATVGPNVYPFIRNTVTEPRLRVSVTRKETSKASTETRRLRIPQRPSSPWQESSGGNSLQSRASRPSIVLPRGDSRKDLPGKISPRRGSKINANSNVKLSSRDDKPETVNKASGEEIQPIETESVTVVQTTDFGVQVGCPPCEGGSGDTAAQQVNLKITKESISETSVGREAIPSKDIHELEKSIVQLGSELSRSNCDNFNLRTVIEKLKKQLTETLDRSEEVELLRFELAERCVDKDVLLSEKKAMGIRIKEMENEIVIRRKEIDALQQNESQMRSEIRCQKKDESESLQSLQMEVVKLRRENSELTILRKQHDAFMRVYSACQNLRRKTTEGPCLCDLERHFRIDDGSKLISYEEEQNLIDKIRRNVENLRAVGIELLCMLMQEKGHSETFM